MREITSPELIIINVLNEIGPNFPDETVKNVLELVEHNEQGLALEVLCSQIFEYGLNISLANKSKLKEAAVLMDAPLPQLDNFSD